MKRLLAFLLLCGSWYSLAFGQGQGPQSFTLNALNACAKVTIDPKTASGVFIQVSGTWSAVLQPQEGVNGQTPVNVQVTPTNSSTPQSNITANGGYNAIAAGPDLFQVCATSFSSGPITVILSPTTGVGSLQGSGGGGEEGSGTVTSVGTGTGLTGGPITSSGTISAVTTLLAQKFFGSGAPGSVATNLPGDLYSDTTNHKDYWCAAASGTAAPACTSVTSGGWTLLNSGTPGGSNTQLQYNNSSAFGGISDWTTNGSTTITGNSSAILQVPLVQDGGGESLQFSPGTFAELSDNTSDSIILYPATAPGGEVVLQDNNGDVISIRNGGATITAATTAIQGAATVATSLGSSQIAVGLVVEGDNHSSDILDLKNHAGSLVASFSSTGAGTFPNVTDSALATAGLVTNSSAGLLSNLAYSANKLIGDTGSAYGAVTIGSNLSLSGGVLSGTGASVQVNGTGVSAANFNGTMPAAPTNGINVTWQSSGSNVSASIVGNGNSSQFLNGVGTFTTPAGGGNVSTSGSPVQYQTAVFATGTSITGVSPSATSGYPYLSQGSSANPTFAQLASVGLNITTTTCSGQFVNAISSGAVGTCASITAAELPAALSSSTSINGTSIPASATLAYLGASAQTFTNGLTAPTFTSSVATGTAPFTVTSTTPVANLSIGGNAATATSATSATTATTATTATNLSGTTTNSVPYQSASATTSYFGPVNNAVQITNGSGVPSESTTLPSGLTIPGYATSGANSNITSLTGLTTALSAGQGGTGELGTLTGVLYGNGSSAHTVATAAQIVAGIGSTAVTNATNATNLSGTTPYSIPYQSASSTTAYLNGNTTATPNFYTSTGTGSATQAPTLTSSTGTGNVVLATSPTFVTGLSTPAITVTGLTTANALPKNSSAGVFSESTIVDGGAGVTVGSPTGGAEGAGTINTTGLYVNGTAVSTGGTPGGSPGQLQYNNGGVFGGATDFTFSGHTITSDAAGLINLAAASPTNGFIVPSASGSSANPTSDGAVGFSTSLHAMVNGSNGTTIVGAAAATGTSNNSTTCTNQVFTVISAVAAPTCTSLTSNFLPLSAMGLITGGTWNATAIGAQYGGTGINTSSSTGVAQVASGTWSVGTVANSSLANSAITIAGTSVSLGGSTSSFPAPGAIGGTTPSTGNFTTLNASTQLSVGSSLPTPSCGSGACELFNEGSTSGAAGNSGYDDIFYNGLSTQVSLNGGSLYTPAFLYPLQGTDSNVLTSGTISGTGAPLYTDANGGATTVGTPPVSSGTTPCIAYYSTSSVLSAGCVMKIGPTTGQDLSMTQQTNGDTVLYGTRATDSSPTGLFLQFQNHAANSTLFSVDVAGNIVVNSCTGCGSGGDTITSPNSTLSVGGTSTNTTLDINLGHANTYTATQTFPANSLTLSELATQAANTVLGNFTSGSAAPTATAVASCSGNNDGEIYTTNTGFGCGTNFAQLNVAETFSALQTFGAEASIASTAHGVLLSENTAAVVATSVGATNTVLNGNTGADPTFGALPLAAHATQAADTMVANMTASTAAPTAVAIPTTAHGVWLGEGTGTAPGITAAGAADSIFMGATSGTGADPGFQSGPGSCSGASNAVTYNTSTHAWGCNTIAGSGTINGAAQYDVPYYSASGTASTLNGAAIAGFQYDSTSGAPAAATAAQLGTLINVAQYDLLVSGGTSAAPAGIAPGSTSGVPLISQGSSSNPAYGTATVAGGGTGDTSVTAYAPVLGGTTTTGALQSSVVGTSGQVFVSQGSSTKPTYIDFPDVKEFPAANCNNTTAGAAYSLPSSSAPTVACRTGTNVNTGVLEFTATSQTAQFQVEIPADWDSSTNPNARILFTQGNANGSQTLTMQIASGCGATDDASFNSLQSFGSATSGTTANTQYQETLTGLTMTGCSAGDMMNIKLNSSAVGTNQIWVQMVTLTFPRLLVVQAN